MAPAPSGYVQAVPIYLKSDTDVARYFRECIDEIDKISGPHIQIVIAGDVAAGDAGGIAGVVDLGQRFPGLRLGMLPCLVIEDASGAKFIFRLPREFAEISQAIKTLADIVRDTRDVSEIRQRLPAALVADVRSRSPIVQAILKGLPVTKPQERRTAVIFGVIFVTAIFVTALFISNPTPFQYTVFRIILALAAGGFVSMTPGFIEAKVGNFIKAGGALAVFLIVYFYAPAVLEGVVNKP